MIPPGGSTQIQIQGSLANLAGGLHHGTLAIGLSDKSAHTIEVLTLVNTAASGGTSAARTQAIGATSDSVCKPAPGVPQLTTAFSSLEQGATVTSPGPVLVSVTVQDACKHAVADGPVYVEFSTIDGQPADPVLNLTATAANDGTWQASWTPSTLGGVRLRARSFSGSQTNTLVGKTDLLYVNVQPAVAGASALITGVDNAASVKNVNQVAIGGLISIYGSRLSGNALNAQKLPFPFILNDTRVFLGDTQLPLIFVSDQQVNALVPLQLSVSDAQASLMVIRGETQSTPISLAMTDVQPAIFTQNQKGFGQGAVLNANEPFLADKDHPARRGGYVELYCTGLGAVDGAPPPAGDPAPTDPLLKTLATPTVKIGGFDAPVLFSGLAPAFAGLYQVNVQVPQAVAVGDAVEVILTISGQPSNPVTIAVK